MKFSDSKIWSRANNRESKLTNKWRFCFKTADVKWVYVLPSILACFVYINGIYGDFVHDDIYAITRNDDVIGVTSVWDVFGNDFWGKPMLSKLSHKSYRPITVLSFRVNHWIHGLNPVPFHIVNVGLHVLVTSLLVLTCRYVLKFEENHSVITGFLFAVHPVHVEAVTGIVGRADLMAAMFYLLTVVCYSRAIDVEVNSKTRLTASSGYLLLTVAMATAATLCKENGITALGVCALFDVLTKVQTIKCRKPTMNTEIQQFFKRVTILVLFAVGLLTCRLLLMNGDFPNFQQRDNPAAFHDDSITRLLSRGHIWTYNLWLLSSPITLCYDWQHGSIPLVESICDIRNLATVMTIGTTILTFGIGVNEIVQWKRPIHKGINQTLASLIFLVVPFLPASNLFFTVGFVLAERVLYIPSMGYCMLVGHGFCRMYTFTRNYKRQVRVCMALLIVLLGIRTGQQNLTWRSRETLFRSGVNTMPHNSKVHFNYANFLKDAGKPDEAMDYYREAIRIDPTYPSALNNLGTLLGDSNEAERYFRNALEGNPSHHGAHINLGNTLLKQKRKEEGLFYLRQALEIEPTNPEALIALASALLDNGQFLEAEGHVNACIKHDPAYAEAYMVYGQLKSNQGLHSEAAKYFMKVQDLQPGHLPSLMNAATAYRHLQNYTTAEHLLKDALSIQRDVNILDQLAMLYYGAGRLSDAVAVYKDMDAITERNSSETIVRYARILGASDQLQKAEEVLDTGSDKFPVNVDVLLTKALVKSNLQKFDEAIAILTTAITLSANSEVLVEMYLQRGHNYKDIQHYGNALLDFERVVALNRNHSAAHSNIGVIHHIQGNRTAALYHYRVAMEIDPSDALVKANLRKLERSQNSQRPPS